MDVFKRILSLIPIFGWLVMILDDLDEFPYSGDYKATWVVYQIVITIVLVVTYSITSVGNSDFGIRINTSDRGREVYVSYIYEGSMGEQLKLRDGDIIVFINGERVNDISDLEQIVKYIEYNTKVRVQVDRHGKTVILEGILKSDYCEDCKTNHNTAQL